VVFAQTYQPSSDGLLVMEAEHYTANLAQGVHTWSETSVPGYVGDGAMQAMPDIGAVLNSNFGTSSPRLDFDVDFAVAGAMNVWMRGFGPSWNADSVWIGIDGVVSNVLFASPPKDAYGWIRPSGSLTVPSAGKHTINVWFREDGTIVDRLLLTPNGSVRPTGDGPPESNRDGNSTGGGSELPLSDDFSDGNYDGWTIVDDSTQFPSSWSASSTAMVQSQWTNSSGKDVTESYHRGSFARLTSSNGLTDYRLSVDVTPASGSADDIGVMFRYTDNNNYYRVSLNSLNGFARLESNLNGTFFTLARNFRGYRPGESLNIVIEADGPLIQVSVNGDPLFSARDTDHPNGGIALYSRDNSEFDNVNITANDASPEIVIRSPVAHSVLPNGPLSVDVTAIARNVPSPNGSVRVQYSTGGAPILCNVAAEGPAGVFTAQCPGMPANEYAIEALLLDNGVEVDRDTNESVAIGSVATGGNRYDALGNSITRGVGDNFGADNLALLDQRTIGVSGWPALLGDLLTTAEGAANLVGNEGIPGDRADDLRFTRLASILERNPDSNRALVTIGTNDSNSFGTTTPSALVSHIQNIINELQGAGRERVYVALLPPAWGDDLTTPFVNPLDPASTRNQVIINYNTAILSLVPQSGVLLGPDLFSCFLTPSVNRFSLFKDNLHPNALGHAFIAGLWRDAIVNGPVAPPMNPCPAPIYILESIDPYVHGHKQNYLEAGDPYYTDASFTLTSVPSELANGIFVSQANADNNNGDASFLSFDAGAVPVTVYIAYDPAGTPPASSTDSFAPVALSSNLTVSDPAIGAFSIVRATGVTGPVIIGGTQSGPGSASQQSYLVIVVP
jgi:lysophospholipase L1-like esterase